MYQVYTQQRPGRPRWALGSSAILLLVTVGLAAALIRYKTGGDTTVLKPFSTSQFAGKLPLGWKGIETELPAGTDVALAEPVSEQGAGRQIFVFARLVPPVAARPERIAAAVARDYATELFGLAVAGSGDMPEGPQKTVVADSSLAGFQAVTLELNVKPRQGSPVYCVIRTAMLTRIHVIGVALLVKGDLRRTDTRLLDRVSRELEIPSLKPGDAPDDTDQLPEIPAGMDRLF